MNSKRLLSVIAALCMVVCLLGSDSSVLAEGATSGSCGYGVTWSYNASTGTLTISGNGTMQDYCHNAPWNSYTPEIKHIVIEEGVTRIGQLAFSYYHDSENNLIAYDKLDSVSIPSSLTAIGGEAFNTYAGYIEDEYTYTVKNVIIKDLTSWCNISHEPFSSYGRGETSPFMGVTNLVVNNKIVEELVIPDGVTRITLRAFEGCGSIKKVIIPASVEEIKLLAFANCSNMRTVVFEGDAPKAITEAYGGSARIFDDNLTCLYPGNNETWTEEAKSALGKYADNILWVAYYNYEISDGENASWTNGDDATLSFRANGDISKFKELYVDDAPVAKERYTVTEGSTVVTLSAEYLQTLSEGTHSLRFVFSDGEAKTTFTVTIPEETIPTVPEVTTEPVQPTETVPPTETSPAPTEPSNNETTPTDGTTAPTDATTVPTESTEVPTSSADTTVPTTSAIANNGTESTTTVPAPQQPSGGLKIWHVVVPAALVVVLTALMVLKKRKK